MSLTSYQDARLARIEATVDRIERQFTIAQASIAGDGRLVTLPDMIREVHRELTKRWEFVPGKLDSLIAIIGKLARGEVGR
ncbi:hypothetical protein [Kineococcus terrestris]|uniref:hypothetical protein n=1 Tax=Kineococcus terrestris TaxID=2044856 RepID=UPI0034DB710C